MDVRISPSRAAGTIAAPPSKSMAHRLLICGGLAGGDAVVEGVADSQDVLATKDCLAALREESAPRVFPCRESGSTLRFFIPLALLSGEPAVFTGTSKLMSRGLEPYQRICQQQGLAFELGETELRICGPLHAGVFELPGNISSQFISGLLFALPLLEGDSRIQLTTQVESRPYIDMTLEALAAFGVEARWTGERELAIPGGQAYKPCHVKVEGDYSNAAFFEALNYAGGEVTVTGLRSDSLQGDRVYADYFPQLASGAPTLDISDCPDLGPVLMAVAALQHGAMFTGAARLAIKESDRGHAMQAELAKFGVSVDISPDNDTIVVRASELQAPCEPLDGHNDHRIVMALSVICTQTGGTIRGAQAVAKSLPDFFDLLASLNVEVEKDAMD